MNSQPKISVIVPVYKTEGLLDRCVESIVGQTYKNLEIILVDDGSPDNCPAMCDEWAEKDSRIRVIHKENGGLCSARNAGMDIATGDYLGFVDSDDCIEPDMYQLLVENAVSTQADISRCGIFVDEESRENGICVDCEYAKRTVIDRHTFVNGLVQGGHVRGVVWNKIYRADAVKEIRFDKQDGASEDILFNDRVSANISTCVCMDEPKYHYIRRVGAITVSEFGYGAFSIVRAMNIFLEKYEDDPEIYDSAVMGYATAAFTVLSGVITNRKCLDRYDELRDGLLGFKKQILFEKRYPFKYKFKLMLLWCSPKLYTKTIRKVRGA